MRLLRLLATPILFGSILIAQHSAADDRIYNQVRMKLASDPTVKGGGIEVNVEGGVVTLTGKVRQDKQRQKAENLTRKVKGVKTVINQLRVDPA
jgi:hyperosmotically inducible protein